MIGPCSEALKLRLKTPATFSLAKSFRDDRLVDVDEFMEVAGKDSEFERNNLKLDVAQGKIRLSILTLHFSYDAQNGFGALVRSSAKCEAASEDGVTPRGADPMFNFRIDGETYLDWLKTQLVG